jgi:hypothetical protein
LLLPKIVNERVAMSSNDVNWDDFNPGAYLGHNYAASVLPEDQRILDHIVQRIKQLGIKPHTMNHALNVGHGAAFHTEAVIQHLLRDSGRIDLVEYGKLNIDEMRRTVARGLKGNHGIWEKFEKHVAFTHPEYKGGLARAWPMCNVIEGSIYNLPLCAYDAGFTFYVPESITDSMEEFEQAVEAFASSIKSGGLLVMAFMIGSEGYATPGSLFPAVAVDCDDVRRSLEDTFEQLEVMPIQARLGARPSTGPQYAGMGLATGIRR